MSRVSASVEVVAILCSDIHLSSRAPIARSAEPDWFLAMDRQLAQLRKLQKKFQCPVICAGDIFDRWYSTPELINFALDQLPDDMYAVPGQHDLPDHSMQEIHRSAYWTLVQAGKVKNIERRTELSDILLYGFGWGDELQHVPKNDRKDKRIKLAVVHRYCWYTKRTCYPGAPKEGQADNILEALKGIDAVVTGDNHKGFCTEEQTGPYLINPGTFFRRKIDEKDHAPNVGLLHRDGIIETHLLNCKDDKFIDVDKGLELLEKGLDLTELVDDLKSLGNGTLDFVEALFQYLDKNGVSKAVRKHITNSMEGDRSSGRRTKGSL